ncbi:MAG: F0F1 ATP synthase subunit alpha [Patescibacteria group bacterium]|mgnify:FL=1
MNISTIDKIRKEIENFSPSTLPKEGGIVRAVGDGVAEIEGLAHATLAEMVLFEENEGETLEKTLNREGALYGMILNLEEDSARVIILGDSARVSEGMRASRLNKILSIPVGEEMIGRVVGALGEPIDGGSNIMGKTYYALEREAYGVIDRSPVNKPLHTGIKAIDSMIPIGRGQRELIIGDRFTGKTTIAIDAILNQRNEPENNRPICIYVAIGQKESKTARLVALLKDAGAMEYTIVISAGASAPAALQFLAPYAGAAVGEYFMEQGKDALVVYDDLSKHAVAYRQLSLLLRRPPGREAYPGDIFYLHSRLLERASRLSDRLKGGSLTALPIIETQEGDVSAYIPTNVISITDGQIFLDTELFNKGLKPAINVGISVSRVGSAAQTKAMKKVAGRIRLELAQFRELEAFMQFSQDLDQSTKSKIEKGERLSQVLNQGKHKTLPFEKQVVVIYAAVNGFFDTIPVGEIGKIEEDLLLYMETKHNDVVASIRDEKTITESTESKLKNAIGGFLADSNYR